MTQAPVDPSAPAARESTPGTVGGSGTVHGSVSVAGSGTVDRSGTVDGSGGVAAERRTEPAAWPWALALAVYSAAVVVVVAWPRPVDEGAHDDIGSFFGRLHELGFPTWLDYTFLEAGANVAMFVPLGFLIARLRPRRWWWGLLAPAVFSGCAELGQRLLRPERVATWADVAANCAGAALGTLLALALVGRPRGRGRSASTPASTRPGRSRHRAG